MTFGATGSSSARIVSFSDAALTGDYTSADAGATARCVEFTSGSGYILFPEVEGPCNVTIWTGNSDTSSKTFNLKTIANGSESTATSFSLANAKKNFKHTYTYTPTGKVVFKIDNNGKKFRVHDVLIEKYVDNTGIKTIPDGQHVRTTYYTLDGKRITTPTKGIYIQRSTTADGKVVSKKIVL